MARGGRGMGRQHGRGIGRQHRHSIRTYLRVAHLGLGLLLSAAWIVALLTTATLRASYTHTVDVVDVLSTDVALHNKLMDDEETGLRGYLLTHDRRFLQPWIAGRRDLPAVRADIMARSGDVQGLQPLVTFTDRRAARWERWARPLTSRPAAARDVAADDAQQLRGKGLFDAYRAATERVTSYLAAERRRDLAASTQAIDHMEALFAALLLLTVGLGTAMARQTFRAVARPLAQLGHAVEGIGAGDLTTPVVATGAREFIYLAESIDAMRRQLAADLSERARAEEALRGSAADLERSNTELQQFAYVASHDLQEPLRTITSYLGLLRRRYRGRLDDSADEFIDYAVEGATRMQRLIQDVLAYSRVGTHTRELAPTDCQAVVERVMADLHGAIEDSGARITCTELPVVWGDGAQLAQLFQNLIGNALKFRADHAPEIAIFAERDGGSWIVGVRDNGIGLDPAYAERIFVIFQRLHTRTEYDGTGIGLALCKKIVERHGGRIWVESAPDEGATFRFTLPAIDEGGREENAA